MVGTRKHLRLPTGCHTVGAAAASAQLLPHSCCRTAAAAQLLSPAASQRPLPLSAYMWCTAARLSPHSSARRRTQGVFVERDRLLGAVGCRIIVEHGHRLIQLPYRLQTAKGDALPKFGSQRVMLCLVQGAGGVVDGAI